MRLTLPGVNCHEGFLCLMWSLDYDRSRFFYGVGVGAVRRMVRKCWYETSFLCYKRKPTKDTHTPRESDLMIFKFTMSQKAQKQGVQIHIYNYICTMESQPDDLQMGCTSMFMFVWVMYRLYTSWYWGMGRKVTGREGLHINSTNRECRRYDVNWYQ